MTPHRSNKRGTLLLVRRFRAVGLIKRASGTEDGSQDGIFDQMNAMLTTFATQGRHDLLEAIRDGLLTPMQVFSAFKIQRLEKLPSAEVLVPLLPERPETNARKLRAGKTTKAAVPGVDDTLSLWAEKYEASDEHRRSMKKSFKAILKGVRATAILNDLPKLFSKYKEREAEHPRSVNLARQHLQAHVRDRLGQNHRLWTELNDVKPLRQPKRKRGRPLPIAELMALAKKMGPVYGRMAWSMAAAGMGNKEYFGTPWAELDDRVHIGGTKSPLGTRERDVPRWTSMTQPACGEKKFRTLVDEASGGTVMLYDFRRTYSRILEESGIIDVNQLAYMGHGAKTITQLYRFGQVKGQLDADAEKIRAYVGPDPEFPLELMRQA